MLRLVVNTGSLPEVDEMGRAARNTVRPLQLIADGRQGPRDRPEGSGLHAVADIVPQAEVSRVHLHRSRGDRELDCDLLITKASG